MEIIVHSLHLVVNEPHRLLLFHSVVMVARLPQNGRRKPANGNTVDLTEIKSSVDAVVEVHEALAEHYSGLFIQVQYAEVELQLANIILIQIAKRITERKHAMQSLQEELSALNACEHSQSGASTSADDE